MKWFARLLPKGSMQSASGIRSSPRPPIKKFVTCWRGLQPGRHGPLEHSLTTGGVLPSEVSITEINRAAIPLAFDAHDYDPLMRWIGDRRLVLIGEASHGTHDFYRERAAITRRLIEEKDFNAVAIEGDWPDTHRVHRFVGGLGKDATAPQALGDFTRFPSWMWRNMDVLALIEWLRRYNQNIPRRQERVGFYGLDLYSLHASMQAVLDFLDKADP